MSEQLSADLNIIQSAPIELELLDGDLNIIQKLDDEPNDVGGLTSAELKAKFDESGNIIKKYINETLIPAVLAEDATEESRKQAEAARVAAEQTRQTNEETRKSNEAARVTAEGSRATAEGARANAETARVQNETERKTAEASRASAETARANAETQRAANETARQQAETQRQSNEAARQNAESQRVSAENARNVWEDYSASKAYAVGNKVAYGGSSYLCIKPCTGIAPPSAEYWRLIAAKGDKGDTGSNFTILGYFDTLAALQAAVPNPKAGDAYGVGTAAPYDIYVWDSVHSKWVNNGNLQAEANLVITEIPKGRMRGDVDGDGKITQNDANLIHKHLALQITLTGADLWCADVNVNNEITDFDATQINRYILGKTNGLTGIPWFADYYNNWTYHKVDDTSGYWTTELSIPAITADTEGSIVWSGTGFTGTFIKAEAFSGGVRIYANYPPIEALPCAVSYHTGAGGQFIIANTGVSETGAKYVNVSLKVSGWSEEKKQTISVPGLKEDALKQLIIPTQPSTDIEKYYNAGIRISARGDNTLTFSCETIPTEDIKVYLVIIPIIGRF